MERDKHGRFVKGNKEGHRFARNGDATECAKRATTARVENRKLADILREQLAQKAGDGTMTKYEYLVAKAITNGAKDAKFSMRDLKDLQALLGENVQKVEHTGSVTEIIVRSEEERRKIESIGELDV